MGITLRGTKGSAINATEHDANWQLFTGDAGAKTLSSGAFTADVNNTSGAGKYVITSESGTADALTTINSTTNGDMVILFAASTHTITVEHATGNVFLQGGLNFIMDTIYDHVILMNIDGTNLAGHGISVPTS